MRKYYRERPVQRQRSGVLRRQLVWPWQRVLRVVLWQSSKNVMPRLQTYSLYTLLRSDTLLLEDSWSLLLYRSFTIIFFHNIEQLIEKHKKWARRYFLIEVSCFLASFMIFSNTVDSPSFFSIILSMDFTVATTFCVAMGYWLFPRNFESCFTTSFPILRQLKHTVTKFYI